MSINDLDIWLLHAVNGLSGRSYLVDQIIFFFSESNLVKTIPFITCLWVLWLAPQCSRERRETILGTIVAVVVALAVTRVLAGVLPTRVRPYVNPDVGFHSPIIGYDAKDNLVDWSSFPSDHATYFFALAAGLWLISRHLGFWFGLWALWISWQRIYLGLHYATDLVAGALIGIVATALIARPPVRTMVAAPFLKLYERMPTVFNAAFFIVLFEMGDLFNEVRQILKGLVVVLRHYGMMPLH